MCSAKQPAKVELRCGKRAYFHGLGVVRSIQDHVLKPTPLIQRLLLADHARVVGPLARTMTDHLWLMKQGQKWMREAQLRITPPLPPDCTGATRAACDWYFDGATQCEVAHEGGFTTDSNWPFAGRFQMDESFEKATDPSWVMPSDYGLRMHERYGRANNWPHGAQIEHAYGQFLLRGWGPWPPYTKYGCSAYHGGTYTA